MGQKRNGVPFTLLSVLCLAVTGLIAGNADAIRGMPSPGERKHMSLVGYNDLQGRESLQVTVKGDWAFVGHHERLFFTARHRNPLTGQFEENGTSILDISDPARPTLVVHIPNFENRNSRSTSVVYDFMGSGKDYLIRNSEGATPPTDVFEIFDITGITRGGGVIYSKVGEITGSPPDSCGTGCGGNLSRAHKGWWSQNGRYYASASEPGFASRAQHLMVWDLSTLPTLPPSPKNNFNDTFAGRGWIPGQKAGEDRPSDGVIPGMHHPIVDEANDRVYAGFLTGGDVAAFDIGGTLAPDSRYMVAWHIDTEPPGSGTHTVVPVYYDQAAKFGEGALPRVYALVSDEVITSHVKCRERPVSPGRTKSYMFDITDADLFLGGTGVPLSVDTWRVPDGDFCERGGRFGPHQFNETVDGRINRFEDKIAFFAYFNAGVRAVDISDPYNMVEVGYYVPRASERTGGIHKAENSAGEFTLQINDVDVDYRGLIYASDRVGNGLFVLEFRK